RRRTFPTRPARRRARRASAWRRALRPPSGALRRPRSFCWTKPSTRPWPPTRMCAKTPGRPSVSPRAPRGWRDSACAGGGISATREKQGFVMDEEQPREPGLFASAKNLLATLVGSVRTRLELVAVDVELERARIVRQLVLAVAAVLLAGIGVLLLTLL